MEQTDLSDRLRRLMPRYVPNGGMDNRFNIHDRVEWDIKGRNARTCRGSVELIVPPDHNPRRLMKIRWGSSKGLVMSCSNSRSTVVPYYTYVVLLDGIKHKYVLVSAMRLRLSNG